jgi:hypothetical protein
MIYTHSFIMCWGYTSRETVGRGWALKSLSFFKF